MDSRKARIQRYAVVAAIIIYILLSAWVEHEAPPRQTRPPVRANQP